MSDITAVASFFSELAFPVAVSATLLFVVIKQLEAIKTSQLKTLLFLSLIMAELGVVIPDSQMRVAVEGLDKS